jgi:hypothetical protein
MNKIAGQKVRPPFPSSRCSFNYLGRDFLVGHTVQNVPLTKSLSGGLFVTLHRGLTARFADRADHLRDGQLVDVKLTEIVKAGAGLPRIICILFVPPKKP